MARTVKKPHERRADIVATARRAGRAGRRRPALLGELRRLGTQLAAQPDTALADPAGGTL